MNHATIVRRTARSSVLVDHTGMPFPYPMPNAPTPRRRKPSLRAKLKEWFRRKDYEDNSDLFLKYLMAFVLYPILVVCVLQFCYLIYRLIIGDPVMGDPGGFVAPIIIMF